MSKRNKLFAMLYTMGFDTEDIARLLSLTTDEVAILSEVGAYVPGFEAQRLAARLSIQPNQFLQFIQQPETDNKSILDTEQSAEMAKAINILSTFYGLCFRSIF